MASPPQRHVWRSGISEHGELELLPLTQGQLIAVRAAGTTVALGRILAQLGRARGDNLFHAAAEGKPAGVTWASVFVHRIHTVSADESGSEHPR